MPDCAENCSEREEDVSIDCSSIFRLSSNDEQLRISALHVRGVNVPQNHGVVGGCGKAERVSPSHADPHTAWQVEDRGHPSALCPEERYYQCLGLRSHLHWFPVQEEEVDSDTIYNSL